MFLFREYSMEWKFNFWNFECTKEKFENMKYGIHNIYLYNIITMKSLLSRKEF